MMRKTRSMTIDDPTRDKGKQPIVDDPPPDKKPLFCHHCNHKFPLGSQRRCTTCRKNYCFVCLRSHYPAAFYNEGDATSWRCPHCLECCKKPPCLLTCKEPKKQHKQQVRECTTSNSNDDELMLLKRDFALLEHRNTVLNNENIRLQEKITGLSQQKLADKEELERLREHLDALILHNSSLVKQNNILLLNFTNLNVEKSDPAELTRVRSDLEHCACEKKKLEMKLQEYEKQRRELHHEMMELKGNIRVFVRVRPMFPHDGHGESTVSYPDSLQLAGKMIRLTGNGQDKNFGFDQVFEENASQVEVFTEVSHLVQTAIDGCKVCIFAYGESGSGKTHTMLGRPEHPLQKGLIPRALEQLFQTRELLAAQDWKYDIEASALEIYNDTIQDLLADGKGGGKQQPCKISEDAQGNVHVSHLTTEGVDNIGKAFSLLQMAGHNRSVGRTHMNNHSSRSHLIFILRISRVNQRTNEQVHGELRLIDLAGSEKLSKSGATGDTCTETQGINKSLSCLSTVMLALQQKAAHIPFRNSKLTHILKPSLEGDSKTLMFLTISPSSSSFDESLCSLRFGARVNSCKLGVPHRQDAVRMDQDAAAYPGQTPSKTPKPMKTPRPPLVSRLPQSRLAAPRVLGPSPRVKADGSFQVGPPGSGTPGPVPSLTPGPTPAAPPAPAPTVQAADAKNYNL